MRTLFEIIESLKGGGAPTYMELKYALLAVDAMWHFDKTSLRRIVSKDPSVAAKMALEDSFRRVKRALNTDPKKWVGWSNDPANPEYQKRRRLSFKIAEQAMKEMDPEDLKAYAGNPVDPSLIEELRIGAGGDRCPDCGSTLQSSTGEDFTLWKVCGKCGFRRQEPGKGKGG